MKNLTAFLRKNESGGIYVMSLTVMGILFTLGFSVILISVSSTRTISRHQNSIKAHSLAEAGIERAVVRYLLKDKNKNWNDNQNIKIYSNEPLGCGTYSVESTQGNSATINIFAIGECHNVRQRIDVSLSVNWKSKPPSVKILEWQEGNAGFENTKTKSSKNKTKNPRSAHQRKKRGK